ncbi:hypothetical protein A3862_29120 [Methylobacterium sp. XJLW]|nr:hypothetical protein A3862_29120 [Methylobacterium sp. XJLW]
MSPCPFGHLPAGFAGAGSFVLGIPVRDHPPADTERPGNRRRASSITSRVAYRLGWAAPQLFGVHPEHGVLRVT